MSVPPPRRVWITRAQPGADETAARVRALKHIPVVAPLLAVEVTDAPLDLDDVAAVAFTSANGVRAFVAQTEARDFPVFAVGQATAAVARAAGFSQVAIGPGDVSGLAQVIAARAGALAGGAVLHAGGEDLAGDLAGELRDQGLEARSVALYRTVGLEPGIPMRGVDDVLLHSPKAARRLAARLKARPAPHLVALCLSPACARPLAKAELADLRIAEAPKETALLSLLPDRTPTA